MRKSSQVCHTRCFSQSQRNVNGCTCKRLSLANQSPCQPAAESACFGQGSQENPDTDVGQCDMLPVKGG